MKFEDEMLERLFDSGAMALAAHRGHPGLTTFLTMAYIVVVTR